MLVSGNTIVVIGYSYARGGTEVGVFDISRDGQLAYRATYHLRSNDYYSSRNYASRLVGSKLIVYSPHVLKPMGRPLGRPSRRCAAGAQAHCQADFRRIAPATRIYRSDEPLDPFAGVALHSVSICDLARPEMDCQSTAVLGSAWDASSTFRRTRCSSGPRQTRGAPQDVASASSVFRIPLDGSAPSALKTAGSPIDQFSFPRRRRRRAERAAACQRPRRRDVSRLKSMPATWRCCASRSPVFPTAVTALPSMLTAGCREPSGYVRCRVATSVRICCTARGTGWHSPQTTTPITGVRGELRAG
jgi:hypothetical protein